MPQWGDLIETGRVEGPWHEVEWPPPAPGEAPGFGWVLGDLVEGGAGVEARFNYCEDRAGGVRSTTTWSGRTSISTAGLDRGR